MKFVTILGALTIAQVTALICCDGGDWDDTRVTNSRTVLFSKPNAPEDDFTGSVVAAQLNAAYINISDCFGSEAPGDVWFLYMSDLEDFSEPGDYWWQNSTYLDGTLTKRLTNGTEICDDGFFVGVAANGCSTDEEATFTCNLAKGPPDYSGILYLAAGAMLVGMLVCCCRTGGEKR